MDDTDSETSRPSSFSKDFDDLNSDIVFRSDDNVLFGIHKIQLQANTSGFATTELHSKNEIVSLPETSAVLEQLFKFIYPKRRPKLNADLDFVVIDALAEAAEKYEVYSAMEACEVRMRETLPNHADRILLYAVKHNYPTIADSAAMTLLHDPVGEVMKKLSPDLFLPWALYYDQWCGFQRRAADYHRQEYTTCKDRNCIVILEKLGASVASVADLDSTFANSTHLRWPEHLKRITDDALGFSVFVSGANK
ncbi:hypothetical protein Hypma_012716 [Hypsizygus marmoreus]|uniref:BTB domain-containing protein n=1 Tax=Hypsizygus marmoreus TaxID=39966 RepID=A0A369JG48_HYPMA|nr:hypothetical protein Hypma_012716 [Hypsizygus marmoreus]